MRNKFVIQQKTTRSVTMTIRIDGETSEQLDKLAKKSNRSRNELINMSLRYALENLEFIEAEPPDESATHKTAMYTTATDDQ